MGNKVSRREDGREGEREKGEISTPRLKMGEGYMRSRGKDETAFSAGTK